MWGLHEPIHVKHSEQPLAHTHSSVQWNIISLWVTGACVLSCPVRSDSLGPHGLQATSLLCSWNSPGKNTGVGCHFLLQGIFLTHKFNPALPHCRQSLYHLSHHGNHFLLIIKYKRKKDYWGENCQAKRNQVWWLWKFPAYLDFEKYAKIRKFYTRKVYVLIWEKVKDVACVLSFASSSDRTKEMVVFSHTEVSLRS